jgi:hypothetical protein
MERRRWKRESGYHRQCRVENALFRYMQVLGSKLRTRHAKAKEVEAPLAIRILNRTSETGKPKSVAVVA